MGIIEDEVKGLHAKLEALETRIKDLETKHLGSKPLSSEQIRMILIGPPGAGQFGDQARSQQQVRDGKRTRGG